MLAYLIALLAMGQSAVVPTEESFVIAKTEGPVTTADMQPESTTLEPSPQIKLVEMDVRSDIHMRYAHTAVVAHMRNPARYAQEASFRVLLPETAFISGFTMTLDGKEYKAYVKEKKEAKEIFSGAVSQGVAAAHIASKSRDSNHFTVSVNVEPNSTAIFNLTYEELLIRRNNVYNHAINLHPGTLVPKLKVTIDIKETQKITTLRVPEVRSGNEIDASESDAQNAKAVVNRNSEDDRKAIITFNPDLDEQRRLHQVFRVKSKDSGQNIQDGVLGQFVVQYDVDRKNDDEILVSDGYFVHFFAPSNLRPLNKNVVFVLDTSGSMEDDNKINKLREAMNIILSELDSGDYFSIIEFNSIAKVHDLNEIDIPTEFHLGSPRENDKKLVTPALATSENIDKAKTIVNRLYSYGGTEIKAALDLALDLIQHTWPETKTVASVTPSSNNSKTESTRQKRSVKLDINYLEPIIIFLTDGETFYDETTIINHISERNSAVERRAPIFSIAFGEDAKRDFLRQLSLRNDGFMRHIYVATDTALQLRDFYRQVSSPVLSGVRFVYPTEQISEGSLTKHAHRLYYSGSEIIVAGRIANNSTLTPSVQAHGSATTSNGIYEKHSAPQNPVSYFPLERLWAYLTIKQMLDKHDAADTKTKDENPEKKALDLALKYNFVTRLTSLVVVKPNATTAVDAESVDKETPTQVTPTAATGSRYASYDNDDDVDVGYRRGLTNYRRYSNRDRTVSNYEDEEDFKEDENRGQSPLSGNYDGHRGSNSGWRRYSLNSRSRGWGNSWGGSYGGHGGSNSGGTRDSLDSRSGGWGNSREYERDRDSYPSRRRHYGGGGRRRWWSKQEKDSSEESNGNDSTVLIKFHLEDCPWVLDILVNRTDNIRFDVNGTSTTLTLTRDEKPPRNNRKNTDCDDQDTNIRQGTNKKLCVYLTKCSTSPHLNATGYAQQYCRVQGRYAGVCCLRSEIRVHADDDYEDID